VLVLLLGRLGVRFPTLPPNKGRVMLVNSYFAAVLLQGRALGGPPTSFAIALRLMYNEYT
jgi:hypothetical protein